MKLSSQEKVGVRYYLTCYDLINAIYLDALKELLRCFVSLFCYGFVVSSSVLIIYPILFLLGFRSVLW